MYAVGLNFYVDFLVFGQLLCVAVTAWNAMHEFVFVRRHDAVIRILRAVVIRLSSSVIASASVHEGVNFSNFS